MAGYLVGAQGDTSAHDIAEKFAKEAAKPDAQARKRAEAEKRKVVDERRKAEEADMLTRARAEAEARREEMLKAREAAELADTQRRQDEEKAELAARAAAEATAADERRQAEALRKAQEDQRVAEQQAEAKRQEEARLQAEAQRRAEEEKRLAEVRKAEEEAKIAALRREEEARAEAARQAEALRRVEEEHRLTEARRIAEEAVRRADEQQRIAERAREQEEMARASEQALRSRLEGERDREGERLADRLNQAREQREARVTTNSTNTAPPHDVVEQGPTVGAEAAGLVLDPRTTRVTVLLLMLPGDRGIRRNNKSADPVLCGDGECYVSNGPAVGANLLPARKALGFLRTWGQRAGACNNSLVCVFRGVDLARLDRLLMPVDMRVVRHDRREMQQVASTSTCLLERGRLTCSDTVQSDDYVMWIVPETLAAKAGPEALQRALVEGLPTGRTALAPSRAF
jgi:colicin import membrane protein